MKKAALHNLGCKVNAYETEAMEELLKKDGFSIVSFDEMRRAMKIVDLAFESSRKNQVIKTEI